MAHHSAVLTKFLFASALLSRSTCSFSCSEQGCRSLDCYCILPGIMLEFSCIDFVAYIDLCMQKPTTNILISQHLSFFALRHLLAHLHHHLQRWDWAYLCACLCLFASLPVAFKKCLLEVSWNINLFRYDIILQFA